ncbi:MAG TPA: FecR family protein [Alphaproteobacteria bacterium]|nr:FecR family protein [Alphaproteobacteria bacterium]
MRLKILHIASIALVWLIVCPAAAEPVGRVIEQVGQAYFIRDGAPFSLRPGSGLAALDRIVTTADGKVVIRFEDGSLCTVGPDSEILLADLSAPEGGWLDLIHGIVRIILAPGARETEAGLRTRAVVASVRSTEFIVDTTLESSAVFVAAGTVQVTGRLTGLSVTLQAGEGTDVALRAPPTPVKRWGDKRVGEVMSRTTLP